MADEITTSDETLISEADLMAAFDEIESLSSSKKPARKKLSPTPQPPVQAEPETTDTPSDSAPESVAAPEGPPTHEGTPAADAPAASALGVDDEPTTADEPVMVAAAAAEQKVEPDALRSPHAKPAPSPTPPVATAPAAAAIEPPTPGNQLFSDADLAAVQEELNSIAGAHAGIPSLDDPSEDVLKRSRTDSEIVDSAASAPPAISASKKPARKGKARFKIGKSSTAGADEAAPESEPPPGGQRTGRSGARPGRKRGTHSGRCKHAGVIPVVPISRRIYRFADAALEKANRPFARIPASIRSLIGVTSLTTILVSLLAASVMPAVRGRRDAVAFVHEMREKLEGKQAGVGAPTEPAGDSAPAIDSEP